ncbi:MAG: DNA-directed RNA polymerase subunit alpha C-terminal domain-containing protein [Prevotella sp.]|nr:DNA-directed RNA polymerase subunit alpha C-terminal domain-containing protein [Prevotella sp.]
MNILQAKNRIKEIDALMAELQQERIYLEKYISKQPEPMEDVMLFALLDNNDKNFVRTLNCMRQVGVNTLSEFIAQNFTRRDLMQIRNFGKKSIDWMLEELKVKAGVEIE